jgi:hypothetical protein
MKRLKQYTMRVHGLLLGTRLASSNHELVRLVHVGEQQPHQFALVVSPLLLLLRGLAPAEGCVKTKAGAAAA